jgi:UDP-N-acetylmuramate dehydrogenase
MNAGAYGGEMKQVLTKCRHLTYSGDIEELSAEQMDLSYRHSIYSENKAIILSLELRLEAGSKEQIMITMEDLFNRRKTKQPLEMPSAGSVFKRPEGNFAGTLIEQCSLKGTNVGGAMVSPKHAGFIVNTGGATCEDVLQLIELIQKTVLQQTGIALECEIKTIG